jgi:carboxyl-terminal processing protease
VGIELGYIDNTLAVQSPLPDSPAAKAGIQAKDLILHVKDDKIDKDTTGWSLGEAVDKIRGDKGSKVTLTMFRKDYNNNQSFPVILERGEIVVPSAKIAYESKNGKKVAHITFTRFGERTNSEMDGIIKDINSQSPKVDGIILDMRNNPGGYLDGAITVSSEFIKSGTIVTQKGKVTSKDYQSVGTARLANYPVVVLVNGGSASAAEITAGALRDDKGAELIGEKTFGKGSVQDAMQLSDGSGLHVTIAKWLLPKGDWITGTGIPVNVEVKDDPATPVDEAVAKAVDEVLKK